VTIEQFVAILGALTVLLVAVARVLAEVREYHRAVNGKMDTLLALTAKSSLAEGKLSTTKGRRAP
jgi:hypothetical protein